jgi:hypothetical protein
LPVDIIIIKQTENREIAPYSWINPDEDHKATSSEIGVLKHCLEHCSSIHRDGPFSSRFSILPTRSTLMGISVAESRSPDQPRAEVTAVTAAIASQTSHLQSPAAGGSYAPWVHMIKLTEAREITPYTWVSPTTVTAAEGILLASNSSRRPRNVSMAVSAGARCSAIAVGSSQPSARCNTSSGGHVDLEA